MKLMKRTIYLLACLLIAGTAAAQSLLTPEQLAKREKRKNLTVKEWNTDAKTKARWLDHLKVYDSQGRCIEEIEYASYGQRSRVTYTYDDTTGKVLEEVEYNDRNKPVRIRKYEWNANGTKPNSTTICPTANYTASKYLSISSLISKYDPISLNEMESNRTDDVPARDRCHLSSGLVTKNGASASFFL